MLPGKPRITNMLRIRRKQLDAGKMHLFKFYWCGAWGYIILGTTTHEGLWYGIHNAGCCGTPPIISFSSNWLSHEVVLHEFLHYLTFLDNPAMEAVKDCGHEATVYALTSQFHRLSLIEDAVNITMNFMEKVLREPDGDSLKLGAKPSEEEEGGNHER